MISLKKHFYAIKNHPSLPKQKNPAIQKSANKLPVFKHEFFNFKISQDRLFYPVEVFVASVTANFCLMQCLVFNSHLIKFS